MWRAHLMVSPPKNGGSSLTAVLPPKEGATGRRAIAVAAKELISIGSVGGAATTMDNYKTELMKTLDHTASILRYTPNGMRMRVQFGSLLLDEWKREKAEYSFAELDGLVRRAGTRGTAHMLNM